MPFLFTGGRIKREQTLVRGAQIKHVTDFNRRHFVGQFTDRLASSGRRYGIPGFLQVLNVVRVDLLERGVALTFLITAISWPVAIRDLRDSRSWGGFGIQRTVNLLRVVKTGPVRMPPLISRATTSAATAPLEGTIRRRHTNGRISQIPKKTRCHCAASVPRSRNRLPRHPRSWLRGKAA